MIKENGFDLKKIEKDDIKFNSNPENLRTLVESYRQGEITDKNALRLYNHLGNELEKNQLMKVIKRDKNPGSEKTFAEYAKIIEKLIAEMESIPGFIEIINQKEKLD